MHELCFSLEMRHLLYFLVLATYFCLELFGMLQRYRYSKLEFLFNL